MAELSDQTTARAAALEALVRIAERRTPLEDALEQAPGFDALEARDRAFARLLVAACLRHAGEIRALTAACLVKPLPPTAHRLRHALGIGIAQLLFTETPPHAAVDTTVSLAATFKQGRYKGLVNAVLRRIARDGRGMLDGLDAPRINTPDWLWAQWSESFGEASTRAIAIGHMVEPPLDLTPREGSEAETWAERLGARVLPTGTLRLVHAGSVARLPGFAEGAWWVQDAAAALPARLLGGVRGLGVLDMCAAPGGKALQLAAAGAAVTALDVSESRLRLVAENLARTGLSAELVAADARSFTAPAPFDAVLLDAPCTATGTIRRHPDISWSKGPKDAERLAPLQDALLGAAARAVKPGGLLVYAVCSLDPREGPDRVAAFLAAHGDFAPVPVEAGEIGGLGEAIDSAGALRTLPSHLADLGGVDGFYAARLRRTSEADR